MNTAVVFVSGVLVLALISRIQPMRGWLRDLLAERYLIAFVVPLFALFGWPVEGVEAFREGSELGWQRVARVALFGLVAIAFMMRTVRLRSIVVPRTFTLRVFAAYAALCALSASYSPEPLQTLWKAVELFVLLMFAARLYQSSEAPMLRADRLANSLLYLAFAMCALSLVGGVVAPSLAWRDFGFGGLATRSMSGVAPMINPNMLGQLGGIVAVVGLFEALSSPAPRRRGCWLVFAVGLATLILAYSRTSIIATVIMSVFLMIRFRRYGLLSFFVFATFILAIFFSESAWTYLSRGQDAELFYSLSGRTHMWEFALKAFEARPLLGHGFFVGHKYVELGTSGRFLATADSTYVETLVNLGVVGVVFVVLIAVSFGVQAVRGIGYYSMKEKSGSRAGVVLFVFAAFVIVRSLTASSFQVLHYNLVFLLVTVIALVLLERGVKMRSFEAS